MHLQTSRVTTMGDRWFAVLDCSTTANPEQIAVWLIDHGYEAFRVTISTICFRTREEAALVHLHLSGGTTIY